MKKITYKDFEKVNLRSGTIIKVEAFPRTRKLAYKIWAEFGPEIGILQTSAQVTVNYSCDSLRGKIIVGCINLEEKNIAGFISQFLLLGFNVAQNNISLVTTDHKILNGQKLH